jgi:hypothetical protein
MKYQERENVMRVTGIRQASGQKNMSSNQDLYTAFNQAYGAYQAASPQTPAARADFKTKTMAVIGNAVRMHDHAVLFYIFGQLTARGQAAADADLWGQIFTTLQADTAILSGATRQRRKRPNPQVGP